MTHTSCTTNALFDELHQSLSICHEVSAAFAGPDKGTALALSDSCK